MPETAIINSTWGVNLESAICEECDWHYLVPPATLQATATLPVCPHCRQAMLVSLEEQNNSTSASVGYAPELLLSFTVSSEVLNQKIQRFAGDIWFAPGDLNPQKLSERVQSVYLPMWLVDRQVQATWQAEAGFNYEVVSHRDSFDENRSDWQSHQVTETRIRWEPRLGRLSRTYDNIPAPALEEHFALMQQMGHYNLEASQAYAAQELGTALIRLPNRSPADAWSDAIPPLQSAASAECQQASQADHMREFRWSADYQSQNWTLLLLPLYMSYYMDDDNNPQPVLMHGQTGHVSGPRRASMKRAQRVTIIMMSIAVVIFALGLVMALVSFFFPPLFIVAGLVLIAAIMVGLLAIAPMVIVWQFNRTNT